MSDGRREKFETIFAEHFDAVLRFALARAEPGAAKDVAAETFFAAWGNLDVLPDAPRAWLFVVARRRLVDHYRAAGRREALQAALDTAGVTVTSDPAEQIADRARIRTAFDQLGARDQELLRLLSWDGLSRAEAAEVLGYSPALLNVRLHRTRKRLRRAIDDDELAPDNVHTPIDVLLATPEPR